MTHRYQCKFTIKIIAVLSAFFLLTGCGANRAVSRGKTGNKVEDTVQGQIQKEKDSSNAADDTVKAQDPEPGSKSQTTESSGSGDTGNQSQANADREKLDCDLTTMGADMVYANVFQMMTEPERFVGKRIRIAGILNVVSVDGNNYYCCIIKDAQGCCQNGIEFVWGDGSHRYPDEYPGENTQICVTGVFETYQENGGQNKYCRLKNAELSW